MIMPRILFQVHSFIGFFQYLPRIPMQVHGYNTFFFNNSLELSFKYADLIISFSNSQEFSFKYMVITVSFNSPRSIHVVYDIFVSFEAFLYSGQIHIYKNSMKLYVLPSSYIRLKISFTPMHLSYFDIPLLKTP